MKIGLVRKELRGEVRAYMRPVRWLALAIMLVGVILILWPRLTVEWPMLGSVPLQRIGWGLFWLAWLAFIFIIRRRTLFYRRRLSEIGEA